MTICWEHQPSAYQKNREALRPFFTSLTKLPRANMFFCYCTCILRSTVAHLIKSERHNFNALGLFARVDQYHQSNSCLLHRKKPKLVSWLGSCFKPHLQKSRFEFHLTNPILSAVIVNSQSSKTTLMISRKDGARTFYLFIRKWSPKHDKLNISVENWRSYRQKIRPFIFVT